MKPIKYTKQKEYGDLAENTLSTKYIEAKGLLVIFKCDSPNYPTICNEIAVEAPTYDGIYYLFDCFTCKIYFETEERLNYEANVIASQVKLARKSQIHLSNLTNI